ncbi:MaoC family dehydratase [Aromatoleum toluolicum]|uniref:MaoC family dehydratase n=1 Tax=Aromatoleum toluolicum TaxID=90060 RepID=A0ABX1NHR8_9RHOO|nr:MaoC family dehydratase [Aromatoleum toluolicum]NMF98847.1 MaoC family dehydratase [Aromatoleum toluolicum]
MGKLVVESIGDLRSRVGEEAFVTDWLQITQQRINAFAEATGDRQWIHVDVDRARKESPYGGTISHGYLTLSLIAGFFLDSLDIKHRKRGVNYGLNRARFLAPVPVDGWVRARAFLERYEDIEGGAQLTWRVVVELKGSEKPACVAEALNQLYA